MKHLRRALKYFIQVTLLFTVLIGGLMLLGFVSSDVNVAFRNGWGSIGLILAAFAGVSLIYPFFGYGKRMLRIGGDPATHRDGIIKTMENRRYVFAGEKDGAMLFHLASPVNRIARLYEDTITVSPVLGGWEAEGLSRDLVRVVTALEHNFADHGE